MSERAPLASTPSGGQYGAVAADCNTAHASYTDDAGRKDARRRLLIASAICCTFMCIEIVGGYISGSLAIMTDAAHLLSDLAGFFISLFAIYLAGFPPSQEMSFGYQRAEIIGATLSVFLIWLLTGLLMWEAVQRIMTPEELDGKIMFITATLGFGANIVMASTLGVHGHAHGAAGGHGGGDAEKGDGDEKVDNINVRAAYIHVLGDMVQSIGVMIAAALIWWKPNWVILDPVCTLLFAIIVLFTTFGLLKDAMHVLMEGTPKGIDPVKLRKSLEKIPGVVLAHEMHIWSITAGQPAVALHLTVSSSAEPDRERILVDAQSVCERHGMKHITIQLETQNVSSRCPMAQTDVHTQVMRRSTLTEPVWPGGEAPSLPTTTE